MGLTGTSVVTARDNTPGNRAGSQPASGGAKTGQVNNVPYGSLAGGAAKVLTAGGNKTNGGQPAR